MAERKRILVVDDERHIVEFLVMNLKQNQYDSLVAYDGVEALGQAAERRPDLILLDSMLPGMSGIETCRLLKQDSRTREIPIIFLTAKSEESDKVIGLSVGADDYITKPFGIRELFARIEAVLRRVRPIAAAERATSRMLSLKDLAIDLEGHAVFRGAVSLALSPTEFALLATLVKNEGKVVGRVELSETLGLAAESGEGRSLDVHLRNLRKKLGEGPDGRGYVETVRGIGLKACP